MTLFEYQHTPKTVLPQELSDGILHVADAPFVSHQRIVFRLGRWLQDYLDKAEGGEILLSPIDVILDVNRPLVLQPDLLYVSQERAAIVHERIFGAPDMVLEVLSPNPRIGRLEDRIRSFAQYGVREIWVYRQSDHRLDIVSCRDGLPVATTSFNRHSPIRSSVFPGLSRTMSSMVG
jgi:Uma2 family endonuclease